MVKQLIIGLIVGIILTFSLIEIRNKCYIKDSSTQLLHNNIIKLVRQTSRWSMAAKQDKNSLIEMLHANYGVGFLYALKNIATTDQIESATDIDMKKFEKEIMKIQKDAVARVSQRCPNFNPISDNLLSKIAIS